MNAIADHHARCDQFIEAVFRQRQNQKPCCRKGCFACCSEILYASEAEADHIVEALNDKKKAEVAARLNVWLEKTAALLPEAKPDALAWRSLNAPCPLLKDGLCMVYDRRPFGCRAFFAIGRPEDCNLPARKHQKFSVFSDDLFRFCGMPVTINGQLVMNHLGILLAERLLGLKVFSAARKMIAGRHIKASKFL